MRTIRITAPTAYSGAREGRLSSSAANETAAGRATGVTGCAGVAMRTSGWIGSSAGVVGPIATAPSVGGAESAQAGSLTAGRRPRPLGRLPAPRRGRSCGSGCTGAARTAVSAVSNSGVAPTDAAICCNSAEGGSTTGAIGGSGIW